MNSIQKINVVFVVTSLGTGGAQMMLYKMLTRLDRNRFCPTVVTLIPGGVYLDRINDLQVPIYDLGMRQGMPNLSSVNKLRKILKEVRPKVVQGWMYHGNFLASVANKLSLSGAVVFWSVHQSLASIKAEKAALAALIRVTAFLSRSVKTVVFSAEIGQQQHIRVGYCGNNTVAIRDNFDLCAFRPDESSLQLRMSLSLPDDAILIGSVARYAPMKDHANLVAAAGIIAKEFPNVHFILIGPGVDGENALLAEQIAELEISDRVHLMGERHDVVKIFSDIDIFTLSSAFSESFPNVLGEAMCCHVPCVTTDVGDAHAIVGDVGIVVPPKNPSALADGLRKFIGMSSEQRRERGRLSRLHIENSFNIDGENSFVSQYERLYEEALLK